MGSSDVRLGTAHVMARPSFTYLITCQDDLVFGQLQARVNRPSRIITGAYSCGYSYIPIGR